MGELHLYILLTLLSFIVNYGFGIVTLAIDHRHLVNRAFAILVFALSWWALMKLSITLSPTEEWASFFYKLSGFGWCLLPAFYVNLAFSLIRKHNLGYRRYVAYAISFVFLGFYACLWIPDLMFDGMVIEDWGYTDVPGPLFSLGFQPLFLLSFVYVIVELAVFASMARRRDDRMKGLLVLVGLLIPLVGGAVTNMILPTFGVYVFELAVPLTTINAAIIAYAMYRYRLMAFRVDYVSAAIIATVNEPLVVLNRDGRIGMASPSAQDMLGYSKGELVGMHLNDILFEKRFLEDIRPDVDVRGRLMTPARFVGKDGGRVPVNLTASKLQNDGGKVMGYVIVGTRLFTTDRASRVSMFSAAGRKVTGEGDGT